MRRLWWIVCGAALVLHVVVLVSICRQSVGVNRPRATARPIVWKLYNDTTHRRGPGADFFAIYHAGIAVRAGTSPYKGHEEPRVTPDFYNFRYLPIVGHTIGRAAITLPPKTAYLAWILVLEAVLAVVIVAVVRLVPEERWRTFLVACLLCSTPYWLELHMGQFTFISIAALMLSALAFERRRHFGATLGLWVAIVIKVFPLAAVPAFLRQRRGLWVVGAAIALAVIVTLPHFLSHPDDWTAFVKANFRGSKSSGMHTGNHGLVYLIRITVKGLGIGWPSSNFDRFAQLWQLGVLGATAVVVLWKRPPVILGVAALMFAHFTSYIDVWEHHMSAVIVCAAFVLATTIRDGAPGRWLLAGCVLLLVLPTPFGLIDQHWTHLSDPVKFWPPYARYLMPACKALSCLALWAYSVHRTWTGSPAQDVVVA